MSDTMFYSLGAVAILALLVDIIMMSRVRLARIGNLIGVGAVLLALLITMSRFNLWSSVVPLCALAAGVVIGLIGAYRVKMISMPQVVALLNGFGGLASALVGWSEIKAPGQFERYSALLALAIGVITFAGSAVAGGKLARWLPQKPVVIAGHAFLSAVLLLATALGVVCNLPWLVLVTAALFGIIFSIRVGGADMPMTISLLNSLSGVAGGISGMAIGDPVLVASGGVVGASGLLLTQIMCRAMNRSLGNILLPHGVVKSSESAAPASEAAPKEKTQSDEDTLASTLREAADVIIVPGYGMALAQAQGIVKQLADRFVERGAKVRYAIHPVAGRMPGHMNVLLCEVDVPYEMLFELETINDDFKDCDLVVAVGANDTINPSANTAEDTPIYGMPVLNVGEAKQVVVCNLDTKPGYAGVPNTLYDEANVTMLIGDAKASLEKILEIIA